MYIKYHKMATVMACLNCYGIPNLLVRDCLISYDNNFAIGFLSALP